MRTRLATPWNGASDIYCAPGRLWLKVELGEAPDAIPSALDVRQGLQEAETRTGLGPVDRVFSHYAGGSRVVRVHTAAAAAGRPGHGHEGYDDVEHVLGLSRTFRVTINPDCPVDNVVAALRQLQLVEWAGPEYLCTVPFAGSVTEASVADLERAWATREQVNAVAGAGYEPGDGAVIVALLDTGVAVAHPEIAGNLRTGIDTVQLGRGEVAAGMQLLGDTTDVDTDPEDEVGHGTSCAAIIGGAGHGMPPGVASGCSILPGRVLGSASFAGRPDRCGVGSIVDIDAGLKRVIDLGARVVNMSFGTPIEALGANDPNPHADVVRYGLARDCVLVAASGNSGKEEAFTPAAMDGVIAVGSVGDNDRPSSFSTSGDHVALCAPGERVLSAGLSGYCHVTGTSFAAPFVTAAAALLVSRANRRAYPLDGPAVRSLLVSTARPWSEPQPVGHGAGILDVKTALEALDRRIDRGPPEEGRAMPS